MTKDKNVQWHPAFYGAMHLELRENKEDLEFAEELILKTLQKEKFRIEEKYSGIYYIIKEGYIRTQIIVSRELSDDNHIWLNSLSTKVKAEQVVKFLDISQNLASLEDVNYSESVWEVMETVNREAVKKVRENEMTKAWAEIVQPKIDEAFDNGFNNGFNNGSMCSFKNMIKEGMSRELAQKYSGLSDELVEKALAEM